MGEEGEDNAVQKQDGIQDVAELRLGQGSCLFSQKEHEKDHCWTHPGQDVGTVSRARTP